MRRDNGPATLATVLGTVDESLRHGVAVTPRLWHTGFSPLDSWLGGGLRAGELTLVAGAPGAGKTTMLLQVARNVARSGGHAAFVCYEHGAEQLLHRLLVMEIGLTGRGDMLTATAVRAALDDRTADGDLAERLAGVDGAADALATMAAYADRLVLVPASGRQTGLAELRALAAEWREETVLVVDYLQKVPLGDGVRLDENERVTLVVEGLKDLALEFGASVVCIVAATQAGIESRMGIEHLRGSTSLAYEADIVLALNDKYAIVARDHLMYSGDPERYRDWVVCTIEKNRNGLSDVDMQFAKRFHESRFDPAGEMVNERLVGDRIHAR